MGDNVSTTSSLSKNSTSSLIFSPSGKKKTYNPYGPESALKKKLKQTKMATSSETDAAYKLWNFSRKTSKIFLALFNKENPLEEGTQNFIEYQNLLSKEEKNKQAYNSLFAEDEPQHQKKQHQTKLALQRSSQESLEESYKD